MYLKATLSTILLISGLSAMPAQAGVKKSVDKNGDGVLSMEEFVMFNAEKDFKQRDRDKNDILSKKEWLGPGAGHFRKVSLKRFDADGNEVLTAAEVIDVYLWAFKNRDKNGDEKLTGSEIPKSMIK